MNFVLVLPFACVTKLVTECWCCDWGRSLILFCFDLVVIVVAVKWFCSILKSCCVAVKQAHKPSPLLIVTIIMLLVLILVLLFVLTLRATWIKHMIFDLFGFYFVYAIFTFMRRCACVCEFVYKYCCLCWLRCSLWERWDIVVVVVAAIAIIIVRVYAANQATGLFIILLVLKQPRYPEHNTKYNQPTNSTNKIFNKNSVCNCNCNQ